MVPLLLPYTVKVPDALSPDKISSIRVGSALTALSKAINDKVRLI